MIKKLHFYVYDRSSVFLNSFRDYLSAHPLACPKVCVTILPVAVSSGATAAGPAVLQVLENHNIDALVSPANSFGMMEGGFDLTISKVFLEFVKRINPAASESTNLALVASDVTRAVQLQLVKHNKMCYNPIQSVVRIHGPELVNDIITGTASRTAAAPPPYTRRDPGNGSSAYPPPDLLLVPTMSRPKQLEMNSKTTLYESVIFNSVWNLLALLAETHLNNDASPNENVLKILITGLGTGVGGVPHELAAFHMYKAFAIYAKALHLQSSNPAAIPQLIENELKTVLSF